MARRPELGNVQLYPNRPLRASDKNGYVLKFWCPIRQTRVRKNAGTRDRREARQILRECRERLLNGLYVESGGAISAMQEQTRAAVLPLLPPMPGGSDKTWNECIEQYREHKKLRVRERSLDHAMSRLGIAERILEERRSHDGLGQGGTVAEFLTLESVEYVQDRLLAGEACRYETRSPMTVNSTRNAVMTFARYCLAHDWIDRLPALKKQEVEDVMKGRPITAEEFGRMVEVAPKVVGERSSASWQHVLHILWESAFRVGDLMNFSWDDERRIHPVWPRRTEDYPTLAIPSSQKNKKVQEIPMLPGLQQRLEQTPRSERQGWIVNPLPIDYQIRSKAQWFEPTPEDLLALAQRYNNCAIARACGVSDTTVRKWLAKGGIQRAAEFDRHHGSIDDGTIAQVRQRAQTLLSRPARRTERRLTTERVSRVITMIGEKAGIVVRNADDETGRRVKYASAHDLRRGCALRLINAGVSAETLKVILRHRDFSTTERFYGATRAAQSAAAEVHEKLSARCTKSELVGGLVGGQGEGAQLSPEELQKLRALLNAI